MGNADAVAVWMGRVLLALAVTAVWLWVLRRLGRVIRRVASWMDAWLQKRGRGVSFRSVELVSIDAIARFERSLLGTTRIVASLAVSYVWLLIVAASLDASHHVFPVIVQPLIAAVMTAASALFAFIPNLMMLALIFVVARLLVRTVELLSEAVATRRLELSWLDAELAMPTRRIVTILVWALALIMAAPYLPGSESRAFLGIVVMLGILLSLGATSVTSNVLAGLVLTYSRVYRVGDRVAIGDVKGEVLSLGALSTRLRAPGGEEVIIPNAVVQAGRVTHFGRPASTSTAPPPSRPLGVAPPVRIPGPAPVPQPVPPPPPISSRESLDAYAVPSQPQPHATKSSAPEIVPAPPSTNPIALSSPRAKSSIPPAPRATIRSTPPPPPLRPMSSRPAPPPRPASESPSPPKPKKPE